MIDPAAPKHAKRLITVPAEAKILQDAVTDVLDRGISLRAVAADLRGRAAVSTMRDYCPTTRAGWGAYPAVAGLPAS